MESRNPDEVSTERTKCQTCLGFLGCIGGLFIQLIIGSVYQWGIINIYVTSYYRLSDSTVNLQDNAIAFPCMFFAIGLTMRLGLFFAQISHPLIVLACNQLLSALIIFTCSYVENVGGFIALYGVIFGLISGLNFMIPIVECNKYFPGKKMYVNGVILIGTGIGSVVFGLFSYNFLNPNKLSPLQGYYAGTPELQQIAGKVPQLLRWLSLLYLVIGLLGVAMVAPVCLHNRKIENQKKKYEEQQKKLGQQKKKEEEKKEGEESFSKLPNQSRDQIYIGIQFICNESESESEKNRKEQMKKRQMQEKPKRTRRQKPKPKGHAQNLKQAFCSFVCWLKVAIILFGSCGVFLINGNYKTYVKEEIDDDQFLTIIGVVASVGNGGSRFFWNLLFSRTGYKTVMLLNLSINIVVFSVIRFAVTIPGLYLFLVFLINCCIGGFLVMTPTFAQIVFGQQTGSNIYGFYWDCYAVANFIQYAFVSQLTDIITFDGNIYICLAMCTIAVPLVAFGKFEGPWKNSTQSLQFCMCCQDKQK